MPNIFSKEHTNRQAVQQRYCEFDGNKAQNSSQCYNVLSPNLKSKAAWQFFGDSQMNNMFKRLEYPYNISLTRVAKGRCDFLNYCQIEKPSSGERSKPNYNLSQGPMVYGKWNPSCTDACCARNMMVKSGDGKKIMEYLVVEYASDVEQQTPYTNTTQETVALYLKKNKKFTKNDTVCVVNTGAHDHVACWKRKECHYLENVRSYLELLDSVCGNIVWIGISSVKEDLNQPQRNELSIDWNTAVRLLIASSYPYKGYFVDVWNVSLVSVRHGNIHFREPYYSSLGKIFTNLM